ncbi:MAG: glycosyltransferase family 4 protein [Raineya sp.]
MKKVLFLFPYPSQTAASQRFRFEQYLEILQEQGFFIALAPFLDEATWRILYKRGFFIKKVSGILRGFARRFFLLFSLWKYDFVFVHREATPIGLPIVEWFICKIFRKKMIFDFDDAIWLPNTSEQNKIVASLKFHQKTKYLCKWAYKVSAGNSFLANYAKKYNKSVFINPTTIDTENWHNPTLIHKVENQKPVVGWTGTHSTIAYLSMLLPILQKVAEKQDFTFLIISDKNPNWQLDNLQFIAWNKTTEIQDLAQIDVGLMPLADDEWAKGKCGFKALQYMAMEIVPLVSPVGVNTEIVQDGINGFLCKQAEDWEKSLELLLQDAEKRKMLGKKARQSVVEKYSILANKSNFLNFFV